MRRLLALIEGLLWCTGLFILTVFLGHLGLEEARRVNAVAAFKEQHTAAEPVTGSSSSLDSSRQTQDSPRDDALAGIDSYEPPPPDQSLWSSGRIAEFAASLTEKTSPVIGVFSIPRLDLELPVYNGATELHMNRGIARIEGTAMPGNPGNLGIAGHRDGYFRVLKDIKFGDEIIVSGPSGPQSYVVEDLMIVDPSEISVLNRTEKQSITLVTCYPFYYVGHAPERFIVRAVLQE